MPTDEQIVFILSICCFLVAIILFTRHLPRAFLFRVVSILFLVLLPFLSALAFAWAQSPGFPLVDSGISRLFLKLLFSVLIGLLTAIFSVRLLFLGYTNGQVAVPFGWILLLLAFFAFGMLHQELPSLLRRTHEATINVTGIHLILEKQDRVPLKGLILDSRDRQEYSQDTSYLFGTEGLRTLVDKGVQDTKHIIKWCNNARPANNICGHKPKDLEALYITNLYLKTLKPIAECLAEYGRIFPNGLPIQDELSEVAVQMSKYKWDASNTRPDNKTVDTAQEKNLKEISDRIMTVPAEPEVRESCKTPFEESFRPKEGQNGDDESCNNITHAARGGLDSVVQKTAYGLADIRACWQKYKKTPHRALMEGYLIAAAGYPHDAARQLERFLRDYCKKGKKGASIPLQLALKAFLEDDCQDSRGWDKWLNNIRYLGELEKFYAFAREYDLQFDTIRSLRKILDEMLEYMMELDGTHTASAKSNVVHDIGHLLTWCAGRNNGKELWSDYIPRYIYYRIAQENRLWDINVKEQLVSVEEMRVGRKALRFVFDNRDVYNGCLVRAKVVPEHELEATRIAAGHNAAQVQTREIIKREETRKAVGGMAYEEYRQELCSARDLLKLVYEQAQERAGYGDKDGEWRDRETKRAKLLLEAIEGANVGPCRSE